MSRSYRLSVTVCLTLLITAGHARATLINFDSLPGMPNFPGAPVPIMSQLSTQLHASTGAVFSSRDNYVAVVNLGHNHAISDFNGIAGTDEAGQMSYSDTIVVKFRDLNNINVPIEVSSVCIRGDLMPAPGNMLHAFALDAAGQIAGQADALDGGGTQLCVFGNISVVAFRADQPNVGWDDLVFPTIPEPGTLSLLLLGGLSLIYRKRAVRSSRAAT